MERTVALKKLRKLLGNSLGYRVDPDAPSREEREAAQAAIPGLIQARQLAGEAMKARGAAILEADQEYQQLVAAYREAKKAAGTVTHISHRYKFTVGISSELFFHVKAEGDSWEEVIAKLEEKVRA